MEYGLLVYDNVSEIEGINIGDYIQSLAAKQFIKSNKYIFCKRDHLNDYDKEPVKLILNGWFSHFPENFPPSDKIEPLFISFHLNSSIKDIFLTKKVIEYLKLYSPIGCRDNYTVKILEEKGIDAYFSGCLTLTLGEIYKSNEHDENIYVVDPFIGLELSPLIMTKVVWLIIKEFKFIKRLQKEMFGEYSLRKAVKAALFIIQYSRVFDVDVLKKAQYIRHTISCSSSEAYLSKAEDLIRRYSKAKLVITSRIHAALPCTGLGTPVIFINNLNDSLSSTCRYDGLINLFNVLDHDGKKLLNRNNLDLTNLKPRDEYKDIALKLVKVCRTFFQT